ncbi:MAG: LysE family transporter [Candidatus Sumerlaeia bacterium]
MPRPNDIKPSVTFSRLWKIVLLAFFTGFSGAMMPGPFLVAVIKQTPVQGMEAPMIMMVGHALLELAIVVLLVLGLRPIIAKVRFRAAVGLIGGAAMIYMGYDMLAHECALPLSLGAQAAAYSWPRLMLMGVVISGAYPYFIGWWTTIGVGQMAHMSPRTRTEYFGFYFGHELADFSWYGFVGVLLTTGARWLTDGIYRGLILFCGSVLLLLGVWFFLTGVKLIRGKARS